MLEIKKDGYTFDLFPGTTINMEISNPIFDDDIIKGNYSFPFKLPLSDRNKFLLNYPDNIASPVSLQDSYTVDIYLDGWVLFPSAILKIKNCSNGICNVYILVGISTFAEYAANTKLAQKMAYTHEFGGFDAASIIADVQAHAVSTLSGTVDTIPYIFYPVGNPGHYQGGEVQAFSGTPFFADDKYVYNYYTGGNFETGVVLTDPASSDKHPPVTMVPFVYATYVIRQIIAGQNFLSNIFDSDTELKKLTILNQFCLDNYLQLTLGGTNYQNLTNRPIDLKNHVPDITVGEFLVGLKKTFCLYLYKNPFSDGIYFDAFKNLTAAAPQYDWTNLTTPDFDIEESLGKGIKYLPPIKGDKFLEANFSMINLVRKPSVATVADLPATGNTVGDLRMVEYYPAVWIWTVTGSIGVWVYWTWAFGDYYKAPGGFELKPLYAGCLPLNLTFYPSSGTDVMIVPFINAPGSYRTWDSKEVGNTLLNKLVFYRGMQPTANFATPYPMGSSHNLNYAGTVIGNYSLDWDGQYGLYNVWWKDYLQLRDASKEVTKQVNLNLSTLLNLDLRKKVRIGANNFFIRKLSLQLPLTKPAKVELLKAD